MWTLAGTAAVAFAVMFGAAVRCHLRTRGEESGVPECGCEDCDDLMAVADVLAAPDSCSWELWEEQCDSLNPLADRVKLIGEVRR